LSRSNRHARRHYVRHTGCVERPLDCEKVGRELRGVFATRKEATAAAKRLMTGKRGQVVVLTKTGKIVSAESHGIPKVQRPAARGRIGSKAIEKAVSTVIRKRLTPA
jgi:hypothetical protein